MQRCLQIAKNGIGTTRPNPSVGAVVVLNDEIIGEGFTSPYGGNHAEVNAIDAVKNKSLLKNATIYVTLEPCSHFGKTPPCAEHHKRFFTVQNKKRPFIILKWAETNNGFIAPLNKESNHPIWISNQYSQQLVHKWRAEEHAILVGTNTVIADNPKLNVRNWSGNNPIRIVLDRSLRIPNSAHVFDGSVKTICFTEIRIESQEERDVISSEVEKSQLIFKQINFSKNIAQQVCEVLQKYQIQSVIIEGGTQTLQTFIDANLWDEARIFIGENEFEKGVKSPEIKGKLIEEININNDVLKMYRND